MLPTVMPATAGAPSISTLSLLEGMTVGGMVDAYEGVAVVGVLVGRAVGRAVGEKDGAADGLNVVGERVGSCVG